MIKIVLLASDVPSVNGEIWVPLGAFESFSEGQPADLRHATSLEHVTAEPMGETSDVFELLPEFIQEFVEDLEELGFELPVIRDPVSQFQAAFLDGDVDLIRWGMDDLNLIFAPPPLRIGPLLPPIPVFARFGGAVRAHARLAFGFDTHGIRKQRETGEWSDIFSGFYVQDQWEVDDKLRDLPEATLSGEIFAGVEINLGGLVAAGADGGIPVTLGVNLDDPNGDGRVHLDEFLDNLDRGFACTFDLEGGVDLFLRAFVDFLAHHEEQTPWDERILDFDFGEDECYPDRSTGNDSRNAAVDIGIGPGQHLDGLSLESVSDEDWYRFEILHGDNIDARARDSRITANDIHDNAIGIRASDIVGPANWDDQTHNLVHDNDLGIVAEDTAEVRFNHVYRTDIGDCWLRGE